ncbi:MAG: FKBP-type peptidyl-prolyl cis-trans isomerase [Pseudomonadota bacterium]|nr:FKBP-type peptidyl-prolyl cis-trans isomerase [Pseudomonadota bacterium]
MKYVAQAVALAAMSSVGVVFAEEALNFEDETTRINYSLGYQIGGDFKRQEVEMSAEAVVQGIQDALSAAKPQMSPAEMRDTLVELKKKVVAHQQEKKKEQELERIAKGEKFMEENAAKEGVVATESGLQYKVIEEGTGKTPGPTDQVTVNYRGTLIDGKEFDSSQKHGKPATFKLNGVIKGWSEGLQLMKEGGKAQLVVPPSLGYGHRGPLAHRTLIFDLELISVGGEEQAPVPPEGQVKEGP